MKVGFITNIYAPYTDALFCELAKLVDLKVYYCAQIEKGRDWEVEFSDSYDYTLLPGTTLNIGSYHLHCNPSVLKQLKKDRPDALIIGDYSYPTAIAAPFIAKALRIPSILWSGSTILERKRRAYLTDIVKRFLIKQYDGYVSYTTKASEQLKFLGADPSKITLAPVTIDTDFFAKTSRILLNTVGRGTMRHGLGLEEEDIAICFVGQLTKRKGLDVLIRALSELDNPRMKILAVGNGPQKKDLRMLADALQVRDKIQFLGHLNQKNLVKVYCASDIFCLPSRMDPSGNTINEAMTTGLPVIISDQIGTDIVRHATDGFIFESTNVQSLITSIKTLADNSELRVQMAKSGKIRAISDFSIQTEARQFREAIRKLSV